MKKLLKLFILFSTLVGVNALAATYTWQGSGYAPQPSLSAANTAWFTSSQYNVTGASSTSPKARATNPPSWDLCFRNSIGTEYCRGTATRVGTSCPTGTELAADGGSCITPPPPPPPVDPCADKNPFIASFYAEPDGTMRTPTQQGECEIVVQEYLACHKPSTGKYCMFQVVRTGKKATSPPPTTNMPQPNPNDPRADNTQVDPPPGKGCLPGSVQIGTRANGDAICMGKGNTPDQPKVENPKTVTSQTVTNSDNSTTTTTTTTITNKDQSTTVIKDVVTKMPNGETKTSQTASTSDTPAGKPGVTDGSKEEQNEFCRKNPLLAVCRNSSVSGTCGETACDGDAIQCATLRETAKMQCNQQKDIDELKASPNTSLGNSILAGNDPKKGEIDAALKGTEVDLSNPNIDQSGFIGGGSCFPAKTFQVMGKTVTMDFTKVCESIHPLRFAVLACAFVIAYLIVAKSVLST